MIDGDLGADPTGAGNRPVDLDTGWADHGARWMAADIGRWHAPDPIVDAPDDALLAEPWRLHPYQYVRNNPTVYWDPDGRQERPQFTTTIANVEITADLDKVNVRIDAPGRGKVELETNGETTRVTAPVNKWLELSTDFHSIAAKVKLEVKYLAASLTGTLDSNDEGKPRVSLDGKLEGELWSSSLALEGGVDGVLDPQHDTATIGEVGAYAKVTAKLDALGESVELKLFEWKQRALVGIRNAREALVSAGEGRGTIDSKQVQEIHQR